MAESVQPPPEPSLSRIPFTAAQEGSIRALSRWMQIAAIISILSALVKVVSAFAPRQDLGKLVEAVITFLIGLWIYQAGTAFRKVADTNTGDQTHLMEGFTLLRRVFLLQSVLVIIVLTFVVIALIVAALVLASRGLRAT